MNRRSLLTAAFAVFAVTAAFPATALATPEKSVSTLPLEVTYYYLPT